MNVGTVLFDDSLEVPSAIHGVSGVDRFGQLRTRRQTLSAVARAAIGDAGLEIGPALTSPEDRRDVADRLPPEGRTVVWCSECAAPGPEAATRLLRRIMWADRDVVIRPPGAGPGSFVGCFANRTLLRLLRCRTRKERKQLFDDFPDGVEVLPCPDGWVGLSDPVTFAAFVSGSFYSRAFNRVSGDSAIVVKSSPDLSKMKAEHDWWYLLPPPMRRFAIQPYGYAVADGIASYRMDRLPVPDAALLWIGGAAALADDDVDALLDGLFRFFGERVSRSTSASEARALAEQRYVRKVDRRVAEFLTLPVGRSVDGHLAASGAPLASLVARYHQLRERLWAVDPPEPRWVVGHGDPCLSNVLFDKRTRLVRLIDPRGASNEAELWDEPTYDLAKLSHSVLGGYDFVNNGLFDVAVDDGLALVVRADTDPPPGAAEAFLRRVDGLGVPRARVRVYEASLFLSMLALHAEAPRRCLGFALTARRVLDEAEALLAAERKGWSWFSTGPS